MMKEYRCTTGEIVWVTESKTNPGFIEVLYKHKWYLRDRSIIGKTLFPLNKNIVKQGSHIGIKRIDSKDDILFLYLYEPKTKLEYRRMGGSYYGATVDVKPVVEDNMDLPDGIEPITINSPIGKAVTGKQAGEIVEATMPDNSIVKYVIFYVD